MAASGCKNKRKLLPEYIFEIDSASAIEHLICIKCKKLLNNVYQTHCNCNYCYDCIVEFLTNGPRNCCGDKNECKEELLVLDENVFRSAALNKKILKTTFICPNESCTEITELSRLEEHLRMCPKQLQDCPYLYLGCDKVKVTKDTVVTHLHNETLSHTELLIDLIRNLSNEVRQLKEDSEKNKATERDTRKMMYQLQKTIDTLNIRINTMVAIGETTFAVDTFDARSRAKEVVLSPYFYSHTNGYKLRLRVHPGGDDDESGTHLSLFIQICKGEYDDLLPWPCKYSFDVSIDNQWTAMTHESDTLSYDTEPNNCKHYFDKPINKDNGGYGYPEFMSLSDIRSIDGILVNDSVSIKCIVRPPPV